MNPQISVQANKDSITISIPGWAPLFVLLVIANLIGALLQKLLLNGKDRKQLLNLAAKTIEAAEPLVPALKSSSLDDYLVAAIRAYADNDNKIKDCLEREQVKPEELARQLKSAPELTAKLFSATPTNAARMVQGLVNNIKHERSSRKT